MAAAIRKIGVSHREPKGWQVSHRSEDAGQRIDQLDAQWRQRWFHCFRRDGSQRNDTGSGDSDDGDVGSKGSVWNCADEMNRLLLSDVGRWGVEDL